MLAALKIAGTALPLGDTSLCGRAAGDGGRTHTHILHTDINTHLPPLPFPVLYSGLVICSKDKLKPLIILLHAWMRVCVFVNVCAKSSRQIVSISYSSMADGR